jgi:hypothetical protein
MNLRASLGAKSIPGTVFRSSGSIMTYGMETKKEVTTTVVLAREV